MNDVINVVLARMKNFRWDIIRKETLNNWIVLNDRMLEYGKGVMYGKDIELNGENYSMLYDSIKHFMQSKGCSF